MGSGSVFKQGKQNLCMKNLDLLSRRNRRRSWWTYCSRSLPLILCLMHPSLFYLPTRYHTKIIWLKLLILWCALVKFPLNWPGVKRGAGRQITKAWTEIPWDRGGWLCWGRLVSEERSKALEESGFCFQDLCGKQTLPLRQSSAPLNPLKIFLFNFSFWCWNVSDIYPKDDHVPIFFDNWWRDLFMILTLKCLLSYENSSHWLRCECFYQNSYLETCDYHSCEIQNHVVLTFYT